MPYEPYKNGTLLIPSGPADSKHLFVVVTDKCDQGKHLLLNFTTVRPNLQYDATCVVEPGEHQFIRAQSYVAYRYAQIQDADRLARFVDNRYYQSSDDAPSALVERMIAGAFASDFTPNFVLDYLDP